MTATYHTRSEQRSAQPSDDHTMKHRSSGTKAMTCTTPKHQVQLRNNVMTRAEKNAKAFSRPKQHSVQPGNEAPKYRHKGHRLHKVQWKINAPKVSHKGQEMHKVGVTSSTTEQGDKMLAQ